MKNIIPHIISLKTFLSLNLIKIFHTNPNNPILRKMNFIIIDNGVLTNPQGPNPSYIQRHFLNEEKQGTNQKSFKPQKKKKKKRSRIQKERKKWLPLRKSSKTKLAGTKKLATRVSYRAMLFTRYTNTNTNINTIPIPLFSSILSSNLIYFFKKIYRSLQYILETSVYPKEPEPMKELRELTARHPW